MKRRSLKTSAVTFFCALLIGAFWGPQAQAQDRPPERVIRSYIPPDQLVSFLPTTTFDQFVQLLDPVFQRVTGKQVIDPEGRTEPIGVPVSGMHFLDAFEMILSIKGLTYRETDRFFLVENAPVASPAQAGNVQPGGFAAGPVAGNVAAEGPANIGSREIRISAILFELNHNRVRDIGLDWSAILGETTGGAQTTGGAFGENAGGEGQTQLRGGLDFFLRTDNLFDGIENVISAPDVVNFSDLAQFFRLVEENGAGETIASPSVTVQSGRQGDLQVGTDIPVQIRDFAGNTVTQFQRTGIIIRVVPTLIEESLVDTVGAPTLEFVHLDINVEKSGGRTSSAGVIIDRSSTTTQVMLLDGEQTTIGGLYTNEESVSRRGIPLLKDLPGWFLGLRYVFGRTVTSTVQKELVIILKAEVVDPLEMRAGQPMRENLIEESRQRVRERLQRSLGNSTNLKYNR